MKEFAKSLYKSKAWQKCRADFIKAKGGLCEECLRRGLYNPGVIVHHIVHVDSDNINDPNITLNFDNLMLLCRDHHAAIHKPGKRYKVDDYGHIVAFED